MRYPRPESPVNEEANESPLGSKSPEISSLEEEFDMLSEEEAESLVESKTSETDPEVITKKRDKSTFERGRPLCEANMFGPLDWALELMGGSSFLEDEAEMSLIPTSPKEIS